MAASVRELQSKQSKAVNFIVFGGIGNEEEVVDCFPARSRYIVATTVCTTVRSTIKVGKGPT